jgi:hypothetical protein
VLTFPPKSVKKTFQLFGNLTSPPSLSTQALVETKQQMGRPGLPLPPVSEESRLTPAFPPAEVITKRR